MRQTSIAITAQSAEPGRESHSTLSTPNGPRIWSKSPRSGAYNHRHTIAEAMGMVISGRKKMSR